MRGYVRPACLFGIGKREEKQQYIQTIEPGPELPPERYMLETGSIARQPLVLTSINDGSSFSHHPQVFCNERYRCVGLQKER